MVRVSVTACQTEGEKTRVPSTVIPSPIGSATPLSVRGHNLHPFPARMAPEIILKAVASVPRGSTVLDSMCGSGSVLRESVRKGHRAIGFDVDPLAVLISKVSTCRLDTGLLVQNAEKLANQAASLNGENLYLPWIDDDEETRKFVDFWFGPQQRVALRCLAWLVRRTTGPVGDALRLAVSKTIITKEPRASLARDTSHSRPHRVLLNSGYDVIQGFQKAIADITNKLAEDEIVGSALVKRADARKLPHWLTDQADLVVTSPPYGNAIDYIRGHRLALVWLGYSIPQMNPIRINNIGRQTGQRRGSCPCVFELTLGLGRTEGFDASTQRRLALYVQDMYSVMKEIYRSLRPGGRAILVVGNSLIDGQLIDNAEMIAKAGACVGLVNIARHSRGIPWNHRYLPPPQMGYDSPFGKRMKEEVVLTFKKKR